MSAESKHTPGPLYVGNDRDEDGFSYYYLGPENEQVARIYYDEDFEAGGDQALADATLYAAAPDLLEALRFFADIGIGTNPDYRPEIRLPREAIIAARAAIAKAQQGAGQ